MSTKQSMSFFKILLTKNTYKVLHTDCSKIFHVGKGYEDIHIHQILSATITLGKDIGFQNCHTKACLKEKYPSLLAFMFMLKQSLFY